MDCAMPVCCCCGYLRILERTEGVPMSSRRRRGESPENWTHLLSAGFQLTESGLVQCTAITVLMQTLDRWIVHSNLQIMIYASGFGVKRTLQTQTERSCFLEVETNDPLNRKRCVMCVGQSELMSSQETQLRHGEKPLVGGNVN